MEKTVYIEERMISFAMNINEFNIKDTVLDLDKSKCKITNKTINSLEVFIKKKSIKGVDHNQWFDMRSFNKRFTKN